MRHFQTNPIFTMTPIKRTVSYQFKDSWLRMQIRWAKYRVMIWCGYEIDRTDNRGKPKWDGRRCRQNTTHGVKKIPASIINKELDALEGKVADIFYSFEMAGRIPNAEELKDRIKDDKKRPTDIWQSFDSFILDGERLKGWAFNTVKSVSNVKDILRQAFPKLTYEDISIDLLNNLVSHMSKHRLSKNHFKTGQKGYSNATIIKHARTLRWFLSWSTQKGFISHDSWSGWTPSLKTIEQPVIFLEWDELMKLEAAQLYPGSEEERAKDFFLFCCFSGLRYSDAAALRKSAVHDGYFEIITVKTATPLRIELNDHSRAILDKYKDSDSEYALPRITNNRLNHLLKEIGEILDIKTSVLSSQYYGAERIERNVPKYSRLSSHCARRTFVCNALALDIPIHVVMKWTGHTEIKSMRPYIEIADKLRQSSMERFNTTSRHPDPARPDNLDTPHGKTPRDTD